MRLVTSPFLPIPRSLKIDQLANTAPEVRACVGFSFSIRSELQGLNGFRSFLRQLFQDDSHLRQASVSSGRLRRISPAGAKHLVRDQGGRRFKSSLPDHFKSTTYSFVEN